MLTQRELDLFDALLRRRNSEGEDSDRLPTLVFPYPMAGGNEEQIVASRLNALNYLSATGDQAGCSGPDGGL